MKTLLLITAVLWWSIPATADEVSPELRKRAMDLYRAGVVHYQSGDFEQAAREFKESFQAYPKPETLYNLAQTHRLLKHYEEAVFFYKQYLATDQVSDPMKAQIQQRVAELEANIKQQQQGAQTATPHGSVGTGTEMPSGSLTGAAAPTVSTDPSSGVTVQNRASREHKPLYKKWWLWTTVGVAVAAGVGVGLGLGLSRGGSSGMTYPAVQF